MNAMGISGLKSELEVGFKYEAFGFGQRSKNS